MLLSNAAKYRKECGEHEFEHSEEWLVNTDPVCYQTQEFLWIRRHRVFLWIHRHRVFYGSVLRDELFGMVYHGDAISPLFAEYASFIYDSSTMGDS